MKKYDRANRAYFAEALLCVWIGTLFGTVLQFFKGEVLDQAILGDISATMKYGLLLIAFISGECLFFFLYSRLSVKFAAGCVRLLKRDVFEIILRRSYTQFRASAQGEYISKYTADIDVINARRFEMLPMFWEILFKIIIVTAALFMLDWRIAFVTIALITTPLYIPKLIEKRLQKAQTERQKAIEGNLAKVNDWLAGFELIKNFSVERAILKRFDSSNEAVYAKLVRDAALGVSAQLITTLISYLSYFVVLTCAAWLVLAGEFSPGDFFIAIGMIDQLSWPLISLSRIVGMLTAVKPVCDGMEEFISTGAPEQQANKLRSISSGICFKDVSFSYGGQPPVLEHFYLSIPKGARCLLKGPSGCGKTTAVNLLLRYYDVESGSIEAGGRSIAAFSDVYGCMTVVRQDASFLAILLRTT